MPMGQGLPFNVCRLPTNPEQYPTHAVLRGAVCGYLEWRYHAMMYRTSAVAGAISTQITTVWSIHEPGGRAAGQDIAQRHHGEQHRAVARGERRQDFLAAGQTSDPEQR